MARFNAYRHPNGRGYLLDVQADLTSRLNVRAVVPVLPLALAPKPAERLNPILEIDGEPHSMVAQYLSSVPIKDLKQPLFNLSDRYNEIVDALDLLFQGF